MSNIIRLCHPFNFRLVLEYRSQKFHGIFSSFAVDLLDSITRASNATFQIRSKDDGYGKPIDGSNGAYEGCIGLLQTNQSDAIMYLDNYPHPAINISQGMVMTDVAVSIMTFYQPSNNGMRLAAQMERFFLAFYPSVRLLWVATMVLSIIALFAKESLNSWAGRMKHRKNMHKPRIERITYEILVHAHRFGEISKSTGLFRKILFSTLSLFSLLVIFYLCIYVNTELVVIPAPKTIRSYEEMLQAGCAAYFISGSDIYRSFESAPNGSIEKSLWDYSVANYPMSIVLFSHGDTPDLAGKLERLHFTGKIGLIEGSDTTPYQMRSACAYWLNEEKRSTLLSIVGMAPESPLHLPLASRDKNAKVIQHGFMSSAFKNPLLDKLRTTLRRVVEAGIPDLMKEFITQSAHTDLIQASTIGSATFGNMEKCMQSVLFMPQVELAAVASRNFENFPLYGLYLFSLQLSILVIEKIINRCYTTRGSST